MHDERNWALIDADHRRLVRAAARLLGSDDAEDAVQDAYVRALESETAELNVAQAWLLTVVRNLAIDRLRRRQWMAQWLASPDADDQGKASPPAEADAVLAQDTAHALRLLAVALTPTEGAAVLLHEVFEFGHAEIAEASGKSEAGSRQQLRRALSRLRESKGASEPRPHFYLDPDEEAVFHLYLQALQRRDPQVLWAMLRHRPISAFASAGRLAADTAMASPSTACDVAQVGGQLSLLLMLDGVTLCVVPLGVRPEREAQAFEL